MNSLLRKNNVERVLLNQNPSGIVFVPNYWQWFAHHKNHGILPDGIKYYGYSKILYIYGPGKMFSYKCIKVYGSGQVICHNPVAFFHD